MTNGIPSGSASFAGMKRALAAVIHNPLCDDPQVVVAIADEIFGAACQRASL